MERVTIAGMRLGPVTPACSIVTRSGRMTTLTVPRALTINRTIVPTPDRDRFFTRARALRTHFQSLGCEYWLFEDADVPGAYIEFAEAKDARTLSDAHASVEGVIPNSPLGARSREQSFAELSEADLVRLFAQSQPSATSPEAHYAG